MPVVFVGVAQSGTDSGERAGDQMGVTWGSEPPSNTVKLHLRVGIA
jgi:hypothetical protein